MASKIDPAVMKELKEIKKTMDLTRNNHALMLHDHEVRIVAHTEVDKVHERQLKQLVLAVFKEMKPTIERYDKAIDQLKQAVFKEMKPEIMKSVDKLKKEVFKEMENKYFKPTAKELKKLLR